MTDSTEPRAEGFIDIVFDGPPSHESGRFVEVEDERGHSVSVGQWIDRGNGLWALRLHRPTTDTVEREKISSATYRALLSLEYDGVEPAISKQQAWHAVRDAIRALPSAAGGETPRTAPESCPHCHDESDCSSVDICRAVDDLYPATSTAGGEDKLREAVIHLFEGGFVDAGTREHSQWAQELERRLAPIRAALQQEQDMKNKKRWLGPDKDGNRGEGGPGA